MKATIEKTPRARVFVVGLAAVLAALLVALAGVADTAQAKKKKGGKGEKIVLASDRPTGPGAINPTGDNEIFVMNPDGTELQQLTFNTAEDFQPTLSPDGRKIAYTSFGFQPSNDDSDLEVYLMNADGSNQQNLTDNNSILDADPDFSPNGKQIAYQSFGERSSNPEGDREVYLMNADGSSQQNLTDNSGIGEEDPDFSPNGKKIAYTSFGDQDSNPEGENEVYLMNADGSNQQNLTNTAKGIGDIQPAFSPSGKTIAYVSVGTQPSNPEGDDEIYSMSANGSKQKNLSNTASSVDDSDPDYAPNGKEIAYTSDGNQSSNPEGDQEVYVMKSKGSDQRNLTNTGSNVDDIQPDFAKAKKK